MLAHLRESVYGLQIMRKTLLSLALFLALSPLAHAQVTINGSTNMTVIGDFIAHSITSTQEFTLTNGETLDNASDAIVRFTADDDAATLLQLKLESDNDQLNIANGDSVLITGIAEDDNGVKRSWGEIDFEIADKATASPDGLLKLKTLVNGTLTTKLSLDSSGVLLENGERIENDVDADIDIVFDDDNAELGELRLRSSIAGAGGIADADYLEFHFTANDHGGAETDYATIRGTIVSETAGSERGSFKFYTNEDGTPTLRSTIDITGLAVVGVVTSTTVGASGNIHTSGNITGDSSSIVTNMAKVSAVSLEGTTLKSNSSTNTVTVGNLHTKTTAVFLDGFNATAERFLFIAPYANTVIERVYLVSDTTTTTADGSSNYTFNVINLTDSDENLSSTPLVTSTTEITANTAYTLAVDQNLTLAQDDVLELQVVEIGTTTDLSGAEILATVEYR